MGERFYTPVQTGPGAHQASYTMGTGFLSPGLKWPGRSFNYPSPSSAEVEERVELYLYSLSGLSWYVLGERYLCLTYILLFAKHREARVLIQLTYFIFLRSVG